MLTPLVVGAYLTILGLLSLYGTHRLYIAALYWRLRTASPEPSSEQALPIITVQLPVFNERNVIELVGKLKKLGYLDDTLMHTLDGKEFVTVEQLRKEIAEEVRAWRRNDDIGSARIAAMNDDWTP